MKKVVISCGPIPARLDSVKFITNRFKGGLAFRTAGYLTEQGHEVTVVAWTFTTIPDNIRMTAKEIVQVNDIFEYYDWFVAHAKDYDAFVMAAAVANLTPVSPYEGKFPSHNYKAGDKFDIEFMIAPRAIDAINQLNPRACLIGYKLFDAQTDDELIEIARHTRADAKANIVFANTPKDAKSRKLAVTADNSVITCDFDKHLELIAQVIRAEYFRTEIRPLTAQESNNPEILSAMALVECFEKTFPSFGTVAVPAGNFGFATTARGHKAGPVLVRSVDFEKHIVYASAKATLNAPTLSAFIRPNSITVHRHFEDRPDLQADLDVAGVLCADKYLFPGTIEEAGFAKMAADQGIWYLSLPCHGYIARKSIMPVDWEKYLKTFPDKYFGIPQAFQDILDQYQEAETLEIGGNLYPVGKYSYDPYVAAVSGSINIDWNEIARHNFDLIFAKNAINYLTKEEITALLQRSDRFIANTFRVPPEKKITEEEASICCDGKIHHFLRLMDDSVLEHEFFAYDENFWRSLGLTVTPYGSNSALVSKGLELPNK